MKPYHLGPLLLLLVFCEPVSANWAWMRHSTVEQFTDGDWKLFKQHALQALEKGADGEIVDWNNADTGTHGQIKLLATFTYEGRPCRTAAFRTVTGNGTRGQSVYTLCQQNDGNWKLVPDGTQPDPEGSAESIAP